MISLPSRTRVLVSGSSLPGVAGSGICLTQTATFMAPIVAGRGANAPTEAQLGGARVLRPATMRLLLLVNTTASSVTARGRVVIQKALAADHDVTLAETSRRGHATRLAQGAAADGYDVVVALGGDGTLNETANGLAGSGCALGVLPGGSTNVFARTIGLTNDPIEATGQLLAALARPESIRRIGLGSVHGRYFLF